MGIRCQILPGLPGGGIALSTDALFSPDLFYGCIDRKPKGGGVGKGETRGSVDIFAQGRRRGFKGS